MRILILAVGILAVLGISYCQAAEHPGAAIEHPGEVIAVTVSGTVSKIDAASNEITVKTSTGEEKTLAVGEDAVITKAGNEITLADMEEGDSVTASEENGEVTSIVVE